MEKVPAQVAFDSNYSIKNYRLFEINDDIAANIQEGSMLYIKGEDAGQCVFTTSNKSYAIEKIETSNTVLLCTQIDNNRIVAKGKCGSYFELLNNPMDINKVLIHIPNLAVRNTENDDIITIEELERRCLYSLPEIERAVHNCPYIIKDNNFHLYQVDSIVFYSTVLDLINQCIINNISFQSFSLDSILQSRIQIPDFFIKRIIHFLIGLDNSINQDKLMIPRHNIISTLARATFLLSDAKNIEWLSATDLQNSISLRLPAEYDFDISQDDDCLKGVAIQEAIGIQNGYRFIDVDKLALNPSERFKQLFTIESEWTQEDIIPYIQELTSAGFGRPGDLLLRYCREVTGEDGDEVKKHYVLRH